LSMASLEVSTVRYCNSGSVLTIGISIQFSLKKQVMRKSVILCWLIAS